MTHYRSVRLLQAALLCSLAASSASAQTAADNTKVNTRDRAAGAVTADQQKETAADRDLTKRIRQSVVGDKSLSTYAHNVKIVTRGGQVTLKGPVNSETEKPSRTHHDERQNDHRREHGASDTDFGEFLHL